MQPEESYRAALIALRDSRWEEAARHLLLIAARNPTYRQIDRVLANLQQAHGASFWCAAFDVAHAIGRPEHARTAMQALAALAPDHDRLATMHTTLAAGPSADPATGLDPAGHAAPASPPAVVQTSTPPFILDDVLEEMTRDATGAAGLPYAPDFDGDPFAALELDPLTELVLSGDWQASAPPSDRDPSPPVPPEPEAVRPAESEQSAELFWTTELEDTQDSSLLETQPVPLPSEPNGEFIRLEPSAPPPEPEEPAMHIEASKSIAVTEQTPVTEPAARRYSILQAIGLLSFVLILGIMIGYVLFGQGGETLPDMLARAQAGVIIETASDLIAAVDAELASAESPASALNALQEFEALVAPIAEETPLVGRAIDQWIASASQWLKARVDSETACADADSSACAAARHTLAVLAEQAARRRALVCTWTTCPDQPGASGQG